MRELVAEIRAQQRLHWQQGQRTLIEVFLNLHPELRQQADATLDLICSEILLRMEWGEPVHANEYTARFPQYAEQLQRQLDFHRLSSDTSSLETLTADCGAAKPPPVACVGELPSVPGYEILGKLGAGGRGIVYQARQLSLNRWVVLKMIRPQEDSAEAQGQALFRREAEAVAQLCHPHIVQIYEYGVQAGRPYFAMEWVQGGSLEQRLRRGPMSAGQAAALLEPLARAMHVAHQAGIIHRDLKPGNILLTADGTPKVADFGLARHLSAATSLIGTGVIVGTASYMAPEQAAGKSAEVGPAADIYSLGAVLFEMLTGRPPFRGAHYWDTIAQVISGQEPPTPRSLRAGVPVDLETICLKCLRPKPRARYASAAELAERLRWFLEGKPIPDRPRGWRERGWQWLRQHALSAVVVGGMLLAAILGALLGTWTMEPHPPPSEKPPSPANPADAAREQHRPEETPGTLRTIAGNPVIRVLETQPDKVIGIEALETALVEVVSAAQYPAYRFSAEIRHDRTPGIGLIGLYFGHRAHRVAAGRVHDGFYLLSFADRGQHAKLLPPGAKKPMSRIHLRTCFLTEVPHTFQLFGSIVGRHLTFPAEDLQNRAAPWRKLQVLVTPTKVQVSWGANPSHLEPFEEFSPAALDKHARGLTAKAKGLSSVPLRFEPQGGLGLYVLQSAAAFRQITVEPLTDRP